MLRKLLYDIEVYSPNVFPLPEKAEHPINSVTFYDNFTDTYTSIIIDVSRAGQKKTEGNWTIYYVKDERNLIIFSVKLIKFFSPDVFSGWYNSSFDDPYFFNRCNNLELKNVLNGISPLNFVNIRGLSISGMHLTDMIVLDKKIKKRTSYTLENVAIEENLPVKKLEKHEDIMEIYRTDKDRFVRYNKGDVEVLTELEKKNRIIEFFENTRTFAGLNDIGEALKNSVLVDTIALRKAFREGIILPSKPSKDEAAEDEAEERSGGFVKTPEVGLHHNVAVLDMAKFYPKILDVLNLSTEVIVASDLNKSQIDFSTGDFYVEYEAGKYVRINSKVKGFMPSLYQEFLKERLAVEAEMKKYEIGSNDYNFLMQKRQVVKDTSNSLPGVNGYSGFRLHNNTIANAITFTGQKMIKLASDKLEKQQYKVIYGDTDSLHIEFPNYTTEEVIKKATQLSEELSHGYIEVVKNEFNVKTTESFEIDFESSFKTILYISKDDGSAAKKRYGARKVFDKGKMVDVLYIRGFETRRSDASTYTKALQEQVLRMILWEHPREEIIAYVKNMIEGFKKAPIQDISIPKSLNKPIDSYGGKNKNGNNTGIPAHVKGSIYSNTHLNTNFAMGSKIKYIYITKMPQGYPKTEILSFDNINSIPKGIQINYEKMIDMNIKKKVERILMAANISWNSICGQKSLFEF
jgi:DNA polymerase I